jgi:hypothetical protein
MRSTAARNRPPRASCVTSRAPTLRFSPHERRGQADFAIQLVGALALPASDFVL